ncbi:MAG: hypothetical protein AAB969_03525 [Patescibacteria group bacterium]
MAETKTQTKIKTQSRAVRIAGMTSLIILGGVLIGFFMALIYVK